MTTPDDKRWSIAPTLMWFVGTLAIGLALVDGDLQAFADRLTAKRDAPIGGAVGPTFAAPPIVVAENGTGADGNDPGPPPKAPTTGGGSTDRAKVGALEDACLDGTPAACTRWGLDAFFRAVADGKLGKLGRAVRVSWYGDSVVATDAIPGRLRTRLQGELGDGGPGFVFVVPPHRFVGHEAITRSSTGEWITHAISTTQAPDGLYGAGGSTAETTDGRATIKLVAGKVANVELYYLAQPKGGTATVLADGVELAKVDTRADAKQAAWATATVAGGASTIKLETAGRVRLFGIDLENPRGAVVDNLGIVSVNVKSFANQEQAAWVAQLGHRSADLVMIMIGANEAQWLGPNDQDTKAYAANYEKVLAAIRKGRPDGACLVVSPTDQAEAKDGAYPSKPVMPVLVAAQRKAAAHAGCAFFSTYDWMGAKGSASKWYATGMVGSDFQHLSRKGANRLADAVFDALLTGYQRYAGH
ncbi:MAG: GDSL-type esterase/lipase family protein [Proteobacteria bacterium]|nr:GDSL-type esterase/lipase family protein [Pseudomonadota bacterium]